MENRKFIYLEKNYKSKPEINSGEKKVEKAGYLDTATLVRQMLLAGIRTDATKSTLYDLARGVPLEDISEVPLNPDRVYGFDYFEATALQTNLTNRLKAQHKASIEAKQKAEAQKAEAEKKAADKTAA